MLFYGMDGPQQMKLFWAYSNKNAAEMKIRT